MYSFIFFILFTAQLPVQLKTDRNVNNAFFNAKKGMYWGFTQASSSKKDIKNDLIDDDKLISAVRVQKEVNGIRIESTGFYEGCEVTISVCKSIDNLIREGFLIPVHDSTIQKQPPKKKRK